ncbi:MAG: hypothetical protein ABIL11_00090 [Chloroflexota bacterium]
MPQSHAEFVRLMDIALQYTLLHSGAEHSLPSRTGVHTLRGRFADAAGVRLSWRPGQGGTNGVTRRNQNSPNCTAPFDELRAAPTRQEKGENKNG